jgi:hypothetical protein
LKQAEQEVSMAATLSVNIQTPRSNDRVGENVSVIGNVAFDGGTFKRLGRVEVQFGEGGPTKMAAVTGGSWQCAGTVPRDAIGGGPLQISVSASVEYIPRGFPTSEPDSIDGTATVVVILEKTPPELTIEPFDTDVTAVSLPYQLALRGTARDVGSGIGSVQYRVDGGPFAIVHNVSGDWTTWAETIDLSAGEHTLTIEARDTHQTPTSQQRVISVKNPIRFLDVKITLGSTPEWLVTRYALEATYNTPSGIRSCGKGIFGPEGGVVQGQVSNEGGAFPSSILATVSLDFQPETNLAAIVKNFTPLVTNTGVNFIFEPFQVIQKTDVLLDLQPTPTATDFLLLRWRHNADGPAIASGQKLFTGEELRKQSVSQYEIVFVPDPISAKDFNLQIEGRFQDQALPLFTQTYELAAKAVLMRAQKSASTPGYVLVSV